MPSQAGKVAVITGGSEGVLLGTDFGFLIDHGIACEGIGYGASYTLLRAGIKKLYIISVSKETVDGAKKAVAEELGQEAADKTEWIRCDLGDWAAIPAVAKQITDSTDRLDILINNSARGIMTYQVTDYGVDRHMAVVRNIYICTYIPETCSQNHMGHVILTSHLLPLLKKTAEAGHKVRISNQASNAHEQVPKDVKFASLDELNQDLGKPCPDA